MELKTPSPDGILAALERVSASGTFQRAGRHRDLLRHLLEKAAAGRAAEIKESTIALEVFEKHSYDPRIDSQVRVEIGKLRERLVRYYASEGSCDTLRIEIPKGSYAPVFRDLVRQSAPAPKRRILLWGLGAMLTLAVAGLVIGARWHSPAKPAFKPSIAILPFEDLSPGKDLEYFCRGMTQELIDSLANLQIFQVVPRSSVEQFKRQPGGGRKIGEQLQVQAVVEGTVRKDHDRVRVSVQLIDARSGFQLWTETYDRHFGDVLDIQSEIAGSVSKAFHLDLASSRRALVRQRTRNTEAYLHYLRAAYYYGIEPNRSVEFYRAAVAADPGYALAWAGLAAACNRMVDWQMVPAAKVRNEALAAARTAISIDPDLAEAHHAMGVARLFYERNWRASEQALLKAAELDPANGDYAWEYARLILVPTGRLNESVERMRKAIALEPYKVALHDHLASSLIRAGQYEAALPALDAARKISPRAPSPIVWQGMLAARQGRYEEALERFEEATRITRTNWMLGHVGFALSKLGRLDEARKLAVELEKNAAHFELAVMNAALGEHDRAIAGLEQAVADFVPSTLWIKVDPRLQHLRTHPRYAALVKAIENPPGAGR